MIPNVLQEEVAILKKDGYRIQLEEVGDRVYVRFEDFPLPMDGYSTEATELLVWTTTRYPNVAFDMFWVDEYLVLKNGGIPRSANHIENHQGKRWRRFSIHPYSGGVAWNPNEDSLTSFISHITNRLNSKV